MNINGTVRRSIFIINGNFLRFSIADFIIFEKNLSLFNRLKLPIGSKLFEFKSIDIVFFFSKNKLKEYRQNNFQSKNHNELLPWVKGRGAS